MVFWLRLVGQAFPVDCAPFYTPRAKQAGEHPWIGNPREASVLATLQALDPDCKSIPMKAGDGKITVGRKSSNSVALPPQDVVLSFFHCFFGCRLESEKPEY